MNPYRHSPFVRLAIGRARRLYFLRCPVLSAPPAAPNKALNAISASLRSVSLSVGFNNCLRQNTPPLRPSSWVQKHTCLPMFHLPCLGLCRVRGNSGRTASYPGTRFHMCCISFSRLFSFQNPTKSWTATFIPRFALHSERQLWRSVESIRVAQARHGCPSRGSP